MATFGRIQALAKCAGRRQNSSLAVGRLEPVASARTLLSEAATHGSVSLCFHDDAVAVVELCNPRAANAVSCSMMLQFQDIVGRLEDWHSGKAVVLRGAGDTFCAGADLNSHPALLTKPFGSAMGIVMKDATSRLRALPLISVAAISGAAIGGGAELAAVCDYRVWTDNAIMQWVHVSRGVVPGWGGLQYLHGIVGRSRALYIAGSGKRLSAVQAASAGLADAVVPLDSGGESECASAGAIEFLAPFLYDDNGAAVASAPLRSLKRALHTVDFADGVTASHAEAEAFDELWGGAAHQAFVAAWTARTRSRSTNK